MQIIQNPTKAFKIDYQSDIYVNGGNIANDKKAKAMYFYKCHNVRVTAPFIRWVNKGIVFQECTGLLTVELGDMADFFDDGGDRGHAVQYINCKPDKASVVGNNFRCFYGQMEDHVSCYQTSNVDIINNFCEGGGVSNSGGFFAIGDGGYGDNCRVLNNKGINPGHQFGVVAAGTGHIIRFNEHISYGGKHVGPAIYVKADKGNDISDNFGNWINNAGKIEPVYMDKWGR